MQTESPRSTESLKSKDTQIGDVTDTALWVAVYRALETDRPDAIFKDPHAKVLTGERGARIVKNMPYRRIMSWVLTIRTIAIDELVERALRDGVDTVVNLGAGLDTRPYRMKLPADLRWIEVDFPQMIRFKSEKLAAEKPVCRLDRIEADLSDRQAAQELFARLGSESKKTLVLTEGLLPYLSNEQVIALAQDLRAIPSFRYWIQDYRHGGFGRTMPKKVKRALKNAPFRFKVEDWMGFFAEQGWQAKEDLKAWKVGERFGRPFPIPFIYRLIGWAIPLEKRRKMRDASGYVLLEKKA